MLFLWALAMILLIFIWVFFLPIFIVGFLLSIPFFVIALPVSLIVGSSIYLCFDHIKESSIRDIISSAPFHRWFGEIRVLVPEGNNLICCHPHGVICTMAIFGIHFKPQSTTLIAVTPVLFMVPVAGWIAKHLGAIPATNADIERALETTSVLLLPGGVPEIVSHEKGDMYTQRWGFLKFKKDIVVVHSNRQYYTLMPLPLYDIRMYIAKKYDIPIVFPWIFGWCGTWIPEPIPITPSVHMFNYDDDKSLEENRIEYFSHLTRIRGTGTA